MGPPSRSRAPALSPEPIIFAPFFFVFAQFVGDSRSFVQQNKFCFSVTPEFSDYESLIGPALRSTAQRLNSGWRPRQVCARGPEGPT